MNKIKIVGICGAARSGKTTCKDYIIYALGSVFISSIGDNLAKPIKEAIPLNGRTKEKIRPDMINFGYKMKAEHGKDIFAKLLFERNIEDQDKIIVVDDVRFFEEVNYFKENSDFKLIKIEASEEVRVARMGKKEAELYKEMAAKDTSENAYKQMKTDFIITNNSSMMVFEEEVKRVLERLW